MLYTPTTTDIEKMNRTDLVFELAKHAPIDRYHSLLRWDTKYIRALIQFYKMIEGERILIHDPRRTLRFMKSLKDLKKGQAVTIGVDVAEGEDKQVYVSWEWPPFADSAFVRHYGVGEYTILKYDDNEKRT